MNMGEKVKDVGATRWMSTTASPRVRMTVWLRDLRIAVGCVMTVRTKACATSVGARERRVEGHQRASASGSEVAIAPPW